MSVRRRGQGRDLQHFFPLYYSTQRDRWLVLQHGVADTLLRSGALRKLEARTAAEGRFPGPALALFHRHNVLFSDPPDHSRLRRVMRSLYPSHDLDAVEPLIERVVKQLLDVLPIGREVDLFAALAHPLPVQVICELIGLGSDDLETFIQWSRVATYLAEPASTGPADEAAEPIAQAAVDRVRARIADALAGDRSFLFALQQAIDRGDLLEDEACSMVLMSFSAGHETTASLFAACLVSLGSDEPLQEGLRSGAVSVPAYVDEILRLTSPIQYAEYAVGRRIEVAGRHLAEGERLAIMFGLANQDDRAFHDPEALCPGRPERHIAFGVGRHSCPGGVLAEREVAVALRVLLAQFVVTVDAQAVRWADREFIRGPARVPGHVLRVGG